MSDTIAALRALALSRGEAVHPMHLILDDDLRAEHQKATEQLDALREHYESLVKAGDLPPAQPESLADVSQPAKPDVAKAVEAAEQIIESIEDEAREKGVVISINFHRLAPERYQSLSDAHSGKNWLVEMGDALLPACYVNTTDGNGDDLDLSLDDLKGSVFNHADLDTARLHCIQINRTGQSVPFRRASSGRRATS